MNNVDCSRSNNSWKNTAYKHSVWKQSQNVSSELSCQNLLLHYLNFRAKNGFKRSSLRSLCFEMRLFKGIFNLCVYARWRGMNTFWGQNIPWIIFVILKTSVPHPKRIWTIDNKLKIVINCTFVSWNFLLPVIEKSPLMAHLNFHDKNNSKFNYRI